MIRTDFSKFEKERTDSFFTISEAQFVKSTTTQLGKASKTFGNWRHGLQALLGMFSARCCTRKGQFEHAQAIYKEEHPVALPVVTKP